MHKKSFLLLTVGCVLAASQQISDSKFLPVDTSKPEILDAGNLSDIEKLTQMSNASGGKRLRILGLHNYKHNAEYMRFQFSQGMHPAFGLVTEFDAIDGPFEIGSQVQPDPRLLCLGIEGPYLSWNKVDEVEIEGKVKTLYYSLEDSMEVIKNKILTDGPYDGIAGFSQGSFMARQFFTIANELDPASYTELEGKMPKFLLQFSEIYDDTVLYKYKEQMYTQDAVATYS